MHSGDFEIRQLNHYFGSGDLRKQVLFDIDLDINVGEIVIMTGRHRGREKRRC